MVANRLRLRLADNRRTVRQDDDLEHRIVNFLHGRHVPETEAVKVGVRGGTVVLSGQLHTQRAKWLCVECCRRVAGVIKLVDQLVVKSPSGMVGSH